MAAPITAKPILVTGATGFVAAEVVKQLLEAGYHVRGTTRDVAACLEDGHLMGLAGADERLEIAEADLLVPGAFAEAVSGCEYLIHTASPFVLDVDDPKKDLLDPAVIGTTSILEAAAQAPGVKRIVLTSSTVAIVEYPVDEVLDESHWNESSALDRNPYAFAKAEAERAAWSFMEANGPPFDLVVMNPSGVIGPSIVPRINQSSAPFLALAAGEFPGIPSLEFMYVDVRDVATAHIRGMETPSASGRYMLVAGTASIRRLIEVGQAAGLADRYKLPTRSLESGFGKVVTRLALSFQSKGTRTYLKGHLGRSYQFDNSKSRNELGIEYRDLDETISETWSDLEKWGHLKAK